MVNLMDGDDDGGSWKVVSLHTRFFVNTQHSNGEIGI